MVSVQLGRSPWKEDITRLSDVNIYLFFQAHQKREGSFTSARRLVGGGRSLR